MSNNWNINISINSLIISQSKPFINPSLSMEVKRISPTPLSIPSLANSVNVNLENFELAVRKTFLI